MQILNTKARVAIGQVGMSISLILLAFYVGIIPDRIGAIREGSSATGVDGDQSDNSAIGAGAAYVFDLGASDIATCSWYCAAGRA